MFKLKDRIFTYARTLVGFLFGVGLLLMGGELYTRYNPPTDLQPYLGDRSPLSGPFKQDPLLGVDYADFAAFERDYHDRLQELGPLVSQRITYAWFGNSFVQATGMLGDTAQQAFPAYRMLYLRRNEILSLRVSQLRLLLEQGLRPRRVFLVLLPIDLQGWDKRPLSSFLVNRAGALTFKMTSVPNALSGILDSSDLMRLAWLRVGGRVYESLSGRTSTHNGPSSSLIDDLGTMFECLKGLSEEYKVPTTVLLLPNREQMFGKQGFELQDSVARAAHAAGLDVFDARNVFDGVADLRSVFLPDWHFNPEGNRIVFVGLLEYLGSIGAPMTAELSP